MSGSLHHGFGLSARLKPRNSLSDVADLNTLQPWLVPWADYLWRIGKYWIEIDPWERGPLVVTSARRSPVDQYRLYDLYRRGLSDLPAARPGTSLHEYGLAFDLARPGVDPLGDTILYDLGEAWTAWGGVWGQSRDPVHFQARVV